MYGKCSTCPKLGTCNMAKIFSLSAKDLMKLCKHQKKIRHLSNADIAKASNTPKGTVDRLFAEDAEHIDFKYEKKIYQVVPFYFEF